ncbi:MAG: hypothetical protein ABIR68_04065 [Ilumatobacteraceae bacterium]
MNIFVTVGMGRWPFDRLVAAVDQLCPAHAVVAQIGTSRVRPGCPHDEFLSFPDFAARLRWADAVITHAGNTVRLVQRTGRVPIAVARERSRGEMGNDHQVHFLRQEQRLGRVVGLWDVERLAATVAGHAEAQARLLVERPLAPPTSADRLIETMDAVCRGLISSERAG